MKSVKLERSSVRVKVGPKSCRVEVPNAARMAALWKKSQKMNLHFWLEFRK